MYALSGFIKISALVVNAPGVDSTLGELSQRSQTFSRELGYYSNATYPDVKLVSFDSKRDGVVEAVDPTFSNRVLEVSQWLFVRSIDGGLSDDRENCRQQLINEFGANVEFIRVGNMVSNGTYWLPEQLVLTIPGADDENVIRIWYSDPSFQAQYDLYEVLVVPIVDPLDDLHGPRSTVLSILNGITVPIVLNKVDILAGDRPPTEIVSNEYDWVDKNDPTVTKATPWTVIIYGAAGNNADVIRDVLVDWILENSDQPRSEWEKIYPDLFLPNEFFITPIWNKYSIPNQQTVAGLYSPTLKYSEMMSYGISTFHELPLQHIREHMSQSVSVHKSLAFLSVGNHRNRNGVYSFDELWPQYALISTDRNDFNRLPPKTAEFIMLLSQLLITAESLNEFGNLPAGMSRVKRGENWYLATTFDKMQYLVSLKSNPIFDVVEPTDPEEPEDLGWEIDVVMDSGSPTGVRAQIYKLEEDEEGGISYTPIDPETAVNWESIWYNAEDEVYLSATIPDGSPEQLLFEQAWNGGSAGRIEIVASFDGNVVTYNHNLLPF